MLFRPFHDTCYIVIGSGQLFDAFNAGLYGVASILIVYKRMNRAFGVNVAQAERTPARRLEEVLTAVVNPCRSCRLILCLRLLFVIKEQSTQDIHCMLKLVPKCFNLGKILMRLLVMSFNLDPLLREGAQFCKLIA